MNNAPVATISADALDEPDELLECVVGVVAEAAGVSPLELRPVTAVVDPDALEALVRSVMGDVAVEFGYQGRQVCVAGGDRITVEVTDD